MHTSSKAYRRVGNILLTLIAAAILTVGVTIAYTLFFYPVADSVGEVFLVTDKESYSDIEKRLEQQGYLKAPVLYRLMLRWTGDDRKIQAGMYSVEPDMTLYQLTKKMVSGDALSAEVSVTIPEGYTTDDIAYRLMETGVIADQQPIIAAMTMKEEYADYWILDDLNNGDSLNGYLFPSTYLVIPDSEPNLFVHRMLQQMQQALEASGMLPRSGHNPTLMSVHEVLTFASIVQMESPLRDMRLIAGVFSNRLSHGWRFESDATVNFILGTKKLIPNNDDIHTDSPYNTYLYKGLPPGPIANPGLNAIQATLNPQEHDYFFFLHTPDGETIPSRTFSEHLNNRSLYWE